MEATAATVMAEGTAMEVDTVTGKDMVTEEEDIVTGEEDMVTEEDTVTAVVMAMAGATTRSEKYDSAKNVSTGLMISTDLYSFSTRSFVDIQRTDMTKKIQCIYTMVKCYRLCDVCCCLQLFS